MSSSTDYVVVGRVGKPHGLNGTVVVHLDTDNPDRFAPGSSLEVGGVLLRVSSSRAADAVLLVRFEGVSDRISAEALRGAEITIAESQRRHLGVNEFWPDQLVGLEVRTGSGSVVGVVHDVIEGAAQYRLAVSTDDGIREVPFVAALVPVVDLSTGYLEVADIEGLF